METNEIRLKVSTALIAITEELTIGQDVMLSLQGTVTQRIEKDNDDGTVDVTYVVKGVIAYNEEQTF